MNWGLKIQKCHTYDFTLWLHRKVNLFTKNDRVSPGIAVQPNLLHRVVSNEAFSDKVQKHVPDTQSLLALLDS